MNKSIRVCLVALMALIGTLLASPADAIVVNGTSGSDVLFGTNERDRIRAGGGNDIVFGKKRVDQLFGDTGNDSLFGGGAPDVLDGGPGNDELIDDDSGDDDVLRGREGDDILISLDGGADRINCGPGIDVAFVDTQDVVTGCETRVKRNGPSQGSVVVIGTNGNDLFDLNDNDHIVFGRRGTDLMRAGGGEDRVFGGAGGDSLVGDDDDDSIVDDDSQAGDAVRPGDGDDVIFAADGVRTSIDCSESGETGREDTVYADPVDAVIDCEDVFRG